MERVERPAGYYVEPSEEVVSSTSATRLIDRTASDGLENAPVPAGRALLVRHRECPTEAALLVFRQAGCGSCCGPQLLAAVPLCQSIQLRLGQAGAADSTTRREEDSQPTVMLEIEDFEPAEKDPLHRSESYSRDLSYMFDETHSSRGFCQSLAQLQATAERHGYLFPSRRGNHDWLWSYGVHCLPAGFRDRFKLPEEDKKQKLRHQPSLVFGGTHIRKFVADHTETPWERLQPLLRERELEYVAKDPLRVTVITWNCGGDMPPKTDGALVDLFANQRTEDGEAFSTDVVMVALQETCPLVNTVDITDTVSSRNHAAWEAAVSKALNISRDGSTAKEEYQLFAANHLVGLLLLAFARTSVAESLQDICTGLVRCGKFGAGNKGAVAINFKYLSTTFCFVNSHLHAGQDDGDAQGRAEDFQHIVGTLRLETPYSNEDGVMSVTRHLAESVGFDTMRKSTESATMAGRPAESSSTPSDAVSPSSANRSSLNLFEHDAVIWAGDMNVRLWKDTEMKVPLERSTIFAELESLGQHKEFMDAHDEMSIQRAWGVLFGAFDEAPIEFWPTYKLKKMNFKRQSSNSATPHRSNEQYFYDNKREPAFTDRVLWRARGAMSISSHVYERLGSVTVSDHRPVRLGLTIVAREVKWEKLQEICEEEKELRRDRSRDSTQALPRRMMSIVSPNLGSADDTAERGSCGIQ